MKVSHTVKGAYVSPCGTYRPWLSRALPGHVGYMRTVLFVLNNPSVADAAVDDATVKRGWGFTESWGYHRMLFANTNCHRATDPANRKPMPPEWAAFNESYLRYLADQSHLIVCAWGDAADGSDVARTLDILRSTGHRLHVLGDLTMKGNPRHILYLRGDLQPSVWP